jgi:cytidylate kinase
MNHKSSSNHFAQAMEQLHRRLQAQHKAEKEGAHPGHMPTPFTIAVSREAGANGSLLARAVAQRLGWAVYDRELVQHIAVNMGVRTSLLESVDEKHRSWLLECVDGLSSAPAVSESGYIRHLVQTILSLGSHGECVIVGRGAAQILPIATTLRVRLVGPIEDRIKSASQRFGIPHEQAKKWVETTDGERKRFVKEHFRKDPADPCGYDLVLNSSRLGVSKCTDIIIETLRRLQADTDARRSRPREMTCASTEPEPEWVRVG